MIRSSTPSPAGSATVVHEMVHWLGPDDVGPSHKWVEIAETLGITAAVEVGVDARK